MEVTTLSTSMSCMSKEALQRRVLQNFTRKILNFFLPSSQKFLSTVISAYKNYYDTLMRQINKDPWWKRLLHCAGISRWLIKIHSLHYLDHKDECTKLPRLFTLLLSYFSLNSENKNFL